MDLDTLAAPRSGLAKKDGRASDKHCDLKN
jgi:hypothetical protein